MASLADRIGDPLLHAGEAQRGELLPRPLRDGAPATGGRRRRPGRRAAAGLAERFGMAPAVVALAYLAECLWLLDLPREAEARGHEARNSPRPWTTP
jgi:hypothetical protein